MNVAMKRAWLDIRDGALMRNVWMSLATEDITDQHRNTTLGPIWLLINYLLFAGTFVLIFSHTDPTINFPAYVSIGLLVWFYIIEVISLSVGLFNKEQSLIQGTTLPLTVYVMRLAAQCLIRVAYAAVGCAAILLYVGVGVDAEWLWAALGCLIIVATTPAAITIFAFVGAYFPDMQFVIQNIIRLGMFLTPIFWLPGQGGIPDLLYHFNPFTYYLEIVRVPMLMGFVPVNAFLLCTGLGLACWVTAFLLIGYLRKQLAFVIR